MAFIFAAREWEDFVQKFLLSRTVFNCRCCEFLSKRLVRMVLTRDR